MHWTEKDLPEWYNCKEDSYSAIDRFIYNNEPASTIEAELFRTGLLDMLNEINKETDRIDTVMRKLK